MTLYYAHTCWATSAAVQPSFRLTKTTAQKKTLTRKGGNFQSANVRGPGDFGS